jgi:hypothetical protein
MKTIIGTLLVIAAMLVLAASPEAGATGAAADRYSECKRSCEDEETFAVICKPAIDSMNQGNITQEQVDQLCACGVLLCANVCTREFGEPTQVRPYPTSCVELGVV